MRRLPDGFDGNTVGVQVRRWCNIVRLFFSLTSFVLFFVSKQCPYIFTWSTEIPNKTWGMGSGCAPFYNTAKEGDANTKMVRYFDEDRFEIFATRDIKKDEELLHTYISLKWRTCFSDLNKIVHGEEQS